MQAQYSTMTNNPAISAIVSTKGRTHQLTTLMASLKKQSFQDFEIIVVDQNENSLPEELFKQFEFRFPIQHLHTPEQQGCSRGRNRGLALSRAETVTFPDDDCWYPDTYFERALRIMRDLSLDALTGRPTDESGNTIDGRYERTAQWIDRGNVWTTQIEWIAFWRRVPLVQIGGFDELIGVGAQTPWQSAEGQDLMLRLLDAGGSCWYDPSLNGHDAGTNQSQITPPMIVRARHYGRGLGYVLRKHGCQRTALNLMVRSIGGATLNLAQARLPQARFHAAAALGRLEGLIGRCLSDVPMPPAAKTERSFVG